MNQEKSDLEKYFRNNNKRLIAKWTHYFDVYERHLSRFRDKEIVILEIGVSQGGSLQMWKEYFGKTAKIYGIDVDPRCKNFEEENIQIFIGSQSNRKFLRTVKNSIPPIDILIDDGGHTMIQQKVSFDELFDHVKEEGVYLCEDIHTSYWSTYGGGYRRMGTFIEFSKKFIDQLHAFHSKEWYFKVNNFTRSVNSIHYYDSMIIIEKMKREMPFEEKSGSPGFLKKKSMQDAAISWNKKVYRGLLKAGTLILGLFKLPGLR